VLAVLEQAQSAGNPRRCCRDGDDMLRPFGACVS